MLPDRSAICQFRCMPFPSVLGSRWISARKQDLLLKRSHHQPPFPVRGLKEDGFFSLPGQDTLTPWNHQWLSPLRLNLAALGHRPPQHLASADGSPSPYRRPFAQRRSPSRCPAQPLPAHTQAELYGLPRQKRLPFVQKEASERRPTPNLPFFSPILFCQASSPEPAQNSLRGSGFRPLVPRRSPPTFHRRPKVFCRTTQIFLCGEGLCLPFLGTNPRSELPRHRC